jgi:single-stranded DNA-binding protein
VAVDDGEGRFNRDTKKVEYDSGFYQVEVVGQYGQAAANALKRGDHVYVLGSLSQWVMQASGEGKESQTKTRIRATVVQQLTEHAFGQQGSGIAGPEGFEDPSWTGEPPAF